MAGYCKDYYPEYNNAFENLEKNISRLNDTMRVMMEKFKTTKEG
jgi:GTP pyrophosphokinase